MAKYKYYTEHKETSFEWLKTIPGHWELTYSKWLFKDRNEKAIPSDEMLTASQKYGVIPQKLFMEMEQQKVVLVFKGHDILKHVEKNDFVISMRSFQGGIEYCNYVGAVSSAYVPLEPQGRISSRYFKYLFKSKPYIQALQATTNLVRDGQALRYSNFLQVYIPVLPFEEAETIGLFLDYETAQIDTLIEKQQTLIQLLKEKRQAVISHAVTKGLNPDAPMKDSGVEWLGDVPEHWEVIKFGMTNKNAVLGGNYASSEGYDGIPVIKMGNLGRGIINISKVENLYKNDFHEIEHVLKKGDFLFNTRNSLALVGKVSIWREELGIAIYNSNILRISFNRYIGTSEYVGYLFNSDLGLSQLRLIAKGTTNVAAIYYKDLRSLVFAYPPTDEQYKIVEFLDNKCASLDLLIEKAEQAIQLMQERRTALISAAVTGKIDVRGWRASE